MTADLIAAIVKIIVVVGVLMLSVPMLVWLERKLVADFQVRIGPNRVGPYGLLQSFADGIKLFFKEDIIPTNVDKAIFLIAPVVMMLPALAMIAVIPFGPSLQVGGRSYPLQISDIPVGVLYILAISSLGVYGVVLSGWSSNSKYSLLGGLRSSAQMVSYELPMGLAIVAMVMIASRNGGTLSVASIVNAQAGWFWNWNAFNIWFGVIPGFVAFCIYMICGIAETNRAPFDLPEAETELVAGYHTEYSSMKFAMFFMAEYANMINVAAVATALFLGGWQSPIPLPVPEGILAALWGIFWFVFKVFAIIIFYMWLRATLPRLRYDQLMGFAWKGLVPVSLANIMVVATILTVFYPAKLGETPSARRQTPAVALRGNRFDVDPTRGNTSRPQELSAGEGRGAGQGAAHHGPGGAHRAAGDAAISGRTLRSVSPVAGTTRSAPA
jgi:NADH-quinone oxidoreductase subunit H